MSPMSDPSPDRVSLLLPVTDPDPGRLRAAVRSVLRQDSDLWDLTISCGAGGQSAAVEEVVAWADSADRIGVRRTDSGLGPSDILNAAIGATSAAWVGFLNDHDRIEPDAVRTVLAAGRRRPQPSVIYADSDTFRADGRFAGRFARPDWSPRRLRGQAYIGGLVVVNRRALDDVGGLRPELDAAHLHDLLLRVTEHRPEVVHIPRVLTHRHLEAGRLGEAPRQTLLKLRGGWKGGLQCVV